MSDNATSGKIETVKPAVIFGGSCPVCRHEIGVYRGDRGAALARFHVRRCDGTVLSGVAAFAEVWAHTPGFPWLGRLVRPTPIQAVLERAYRLFLRFRPAVQRSAARLLSERT
jgi:predicted DCC family thiol-disulfide oxidoreductase YuxK